MLKCNKYKTHPEWNVQPMHAWVEYLKFFAGLIAIMNPIGAIPIFINLTHTQTEAERRRTSTKASLTAFIVLSVSLLMGERILNFFGITIASFQVGGGILILLMSLAMLQAKVSPAKQTEEEALESAEREQVAIVPLGVPLLAGPGAISTVVLYGHKKVLLGQYVILVAGIFMVCFIVWISFRVAPLISRLLSRTGINVVTRIMGLIMAAIGVEFIAAGLRQLFPVLT